MLFKCAVLVILVYFAAKWLFRDSLKAFLGKLDRRINRVVNATLVALLLVYALRLILLWLGISE
jgi:hypothetical protein